MELLHWKQHMRHIMAKHILRKQLHWLPKALFHFSKFHLVILMIIVAHAFWNLQNSSLVYKPIQELTPLFLLRDSQGRRSGCAYKAETFIQSTNKNYKQHNSRRIIINSKFVGLCALVCFEMTYVLRDLFHIPGIVERILNIDQSMDYRSKDQVGCDKQVLVFYDCFRNYACVFPFSYQWGKASPSTS